MTCRHRDGDSACSTRNPNAMAEKAFGLVQQWGVPGISAANMEALIKGAKEAGELPRPDAENFDILDAEEVGRHLVLRVVYPSCTECWVEGTKIMVFEDVTMRNALRWRVLDPHFSDFNRERDARTAPPPVARFEPTDRGWADALAYAERLKARSSG